MTRLPDGPGRFGRITEARQQFGYGPARLQAVLEVGPELASHVLPIGQGKPRRLRDGGNEVLEFVGESLVTATHGKAPRAAPPVTPSRLSASTSVAHWLRWRASHRAPSSVGA